MFPKSIKTRYQEHPMSVFSEISCVGFKAMLSCFGIDFEPIRALWILSVKLIHQSIPPHWNLLDLQNIFISQQIDEGKTSSPFQSQSTEIFLNFPFWAFHENTSFSLILESLSCYHKWCRCRYLHPSVRYQILLLHFILGVPPSNLHSIRCIDHLTVVTFL